MVTNGIAKTDSQSPLFEMRGICKRFGATIALKDVDFSLNRGEVHALVGENGAGKSTLMKILSGAYQADSGEMFLEGMPYKPNNPLEARLKGIGMIYQELSLAPHLTVEENISLGMEPTRWGFILKNRVRKFALNAISNFDHPEIKPDTPVRTLSISAQQLVEIGRSLASGCRVLVFDEPTSSLGQHDITRLFEIIKDLRAKGYSIVYISHFLEEVKKVADRITVLRDGAVVSTIQMRAASTEKIIRMMVGRKVKEMYPRSDRRAGEKIVEIKNLSGTSKVLSATLDLYRGQVVGIAGLVGSGRTELLRTIFGLDSVKQGRIKIGIYTGPASPVRRWMQGVGMLSENRKDEGLALNLSISDNVTLTMLKGFGPMGLILPRRRDDATQRWITELDIHCENPSQPVQYLSGGNQQKVALARLLQHDVDILLLDEPTKGIDVAAKAKIYQIIDSLTSSEKGGRLPKAVLMVSSYLPELIGMCDRIAVMYRGRLGPALPVDKIDQHTLMMYATARGEVI